VSGLGCACSTGNGRLGKGEILEKGNTKERGEILEKGNKERDTVIYSTASWLAT